MLIIAVVVVEVVDVVLLLVSVVVVVVVVGHVIPVGVMSARGEVTKGSPTDKKTQSSNTSVP